jgi:hypothetical protein
VLYSVNGTLVERVESCSRPSTFSRQPKRSYRKLNVQAVSTVSFLRLINWPNRLTLPGGALGSSLDCVNWRASTILRMRPSENKIA